MRAALISILILVVSPVWSAGHQSPQHDRVVSHIKAEEPSVFEALWFNPNYLKLTRHKTPSSQDGYAQYICQLIVETGYKGQPVDVEIIDVLPLVRQKKWNVIGKAKCAHHPRQ